MVIERSMAAELN